MKVYGLDSIAATISTKGYFVKCIVNSSEAAFFPGTIQHRDLKIGGLSYEDDYLGNAMAATITPGQIDIRFHRAFADESVRTIFRHLVNLPEMFWAKDFGIRYQGRNL